MREVEERGGREMLIVRELEKRRERERGGERGRKREREVDSVRE